MGNLFKKIVTGTFGFVLTMALAVVSMGQTGNTVTLKLTDASSGEPVGYATVSLIAPGAKSPSNYALSDDKGKVSIPGVKRGSYTLKAEILGYKTVTQSINVSGALNIGQIKMDLDSKVLNAAKVSATGNAIIVKKDTIEYNASSFKTNDNSMLKTFLRNFLV